MIAAYVVQHQTWDQLLPEFCYTINTVQQETTGKTPANAGTAESGTTGTPDPLTTFT